ncbi:MAG TPA: DEAD/DEAH box helicase [Myxococcota bacterium]|nr:DEAD/DEAH box helicase [Myxococcota bacterium]
MTTFADCYPDLPEDIEAGIRDLGWSAPMPVQERVLPLFAEGKDLIVQARTGSGKTGAFGVPISSLVDPELPETQALVMLPTRELANQVAVEITTIAKHRGVNCLPVYGGVGYAEQLEGIEKGAHVVVGTPGRILDHLGSKRMHFDHVKMLVLDEADELLSLGFWPDMREIHSYLPDDRQSCLFSATIPEKVRSLARVFLTEPEFVTLSEDQLAPQEIEHFYYLVQASEKEKSLVQILEYEDPESAIVFCNTKSDVRFVTSYLQRHGFDADQISGDLTQQAREKAMAKIKTGKLEFLVATDVAARGIDISDLAYVINYDTSDSPEVYVHRTGRTGRAGKAGVAISLVSGLDIGNFKFMQTVTKIKIPERKLPTEADLVRRIGERLRIKIEHDLREMPDKERAWRVDRLLPIVEDMGKTREGQRDLALLCAAYLQEHRPETTLPKTEAEKAAAERHAAPKRASDDDAEARDRGRSGGGGGRRGGGGGRSGGGRGGRSGGGGRGGRRGGGGGRR